MQTFWRSLCSIETHVQITRIMQYGSYKIQPVSVGPGLPTLIHKFSASARGTAMRFMKNSPGYLKNFGFSSPRKCLFQSFPMAESKMQIPEKFALLHNRIFCYGTTGGNIPFRCMTTTIHPDVSVGEKSSAAAPDIIQPQRIKFKRLDKTAKHIMNILDKEAVDKVRAERQILDIKPGYIVQLKVEVPENKRRVSMLKGIVIARRNAGLNTTFRLRRLVAGVGVESVFPLYSPNIKEMKVLDKKKVRRAKLYYLRARMNALKK